MGRRYVLVALVTTVALAAPAAAHADLFKTPTGNIACGTGPNAGRFAIVCTVLSEANRSGQKLWAMRKRGRVKVFRSQSNAATEVRVLGYGERYRGFGVRCVSRFRGLRCRNRARHGFFLSRQGQRVF